MLIDNKKIPRPKACIHCIKRNNCKELNKRIKDWKKEHKEEIKNKDMDAYITFPLVMQGWCDDFKEE